MVLQYLCSGSYLIHVLVYMNTSSQNFIVIQEHIICKIPQNFILKLKFFMFSFNNIKTMKDWNNPLFCVNKLINRSKFPNPFPQTNKNVRAGLLSLHKHFISFPKRRWKRCIIFTRKKKTVEKRGYIIVWCLESNACPGNLNPGKNLNLRRNTA